MNHYYLGKANEYIQVQYSKSDRSQCRSCKQKIAKQDIRISISIDDDHFQGKTWYHLDCFQLKPRHSSIDPDTQIYGIQNMDDQDITKVKLYFKTIKSKYTKPSKSKSKKNHKSQPKPKPKPKQSKKKSTKNQKKTTKRSISKKKSLKKNQSQTQSQSQSESQLNLQSQIQSDFSDQQQSPSLKKKPKSQKIKKQVKPKIKPKQPVKIKKEKKAKINQEGYTQQQREKFYEYCQQFQKMSIDQLKNVLAINGQPKSGVKSQLVAKCADGKLLGSIPRCQSCGGGRLRFNNTTGLYNCPGYMQDQDFVHCNQIFTKDQVKRAKWIQL